MVSLQYVTDGVLLDDTVDNVKNTAAFDIFKLKTVCLQ